MKKYILAVAFLVLISASGGSAQSVEQRVSKIRQIAVETRAGKNTDAKFSAEDYQKAADETGAAKYLREIFARMFTDK